jgi:hypothetical protein
VGATGTPFAKGTFCCACVDIVASSTDMDASRIAERIVTPFVFFAGRAGAAMLAQFR